MIEVCTRPKFTKYFIPESDSELILLMESRFPIVDLTSTVDACRDAKDNFLLALCKDGGAEYLVTGDADLLDLKLFESTKIISIAELETVIAEYYGK